MPSEYSPEELRAAREARERRSQVSDDMPEFLEEPLPQPDSRPAKSNTVKIASMAVSLLTLAGFAAIVSYAYLWGLGDVSEGKLPIVAAAAEPEKVRPEEPGGLQVPHQDTLVLNQPEEGGHTGVERLLPPPEEPTPPEPAAEAAEAAAAAQPEEQPSSSDAEGAPAIPEAPLEPTEPIQLTPEKTKAAVSGETPEDASEDATAASAEAAQVAQAEPAESAAPEAESASDESSTEAAASSSPGATQVALKPGDYVIQMAAFRSDDRARQGWQSLQGKHPEELGDMDLLVQRVDIEGKGTFYRVQTGPFPNKATAQDMCAALKARGQACIVTRR